MPWFIPLFFRQTLRFVAHRLPRRCRCQACEPAVQHARPLPRCCRCQACEPAAQHARRHCRFIARRRRRRFVAPQRFDGRRFDVGNYSGRRNAGGYRPRRPGMGRFRGQNFPNRRGSGPATGVAPQPTLTAPVDVRTVAPSVFDFGSTSAALADVRTVAPLPRLPSPTSAVVEIEGDALAYMSAPTGASIFTMGSGVRTLTSAPAARPPSPPRVEADAPRLPSPTPATSPPSPRAGARRRLLALGLPLASPSTSSRGRRAGTWSPAALGLANGASNGVAPGTRLPGGSSDEDKDEGGRSAARRW